MLMGPLSQEWMMSPRTWLMTTMMTTIPPTSSPASDAEADVNSDLFDSDSHTDGATTTGDDNDDTDVADDEPTDMAEEAAHNEDGHEAADDAPINGEDEDGRIESIRGCEAADNAHGVDKKDPTTSH
jgi:hypothetical protein